MYNKQFHTEIIETASLPEDLRYALSLSPEHTVRQNGSIYLSAGKTTTVFPDEQEINDMIESLILPRGNTGTVPENACDLYRRIISDQKFNPDVQTYRKCGVATQGKRTVVVFRTDNTPEKDLYSLLSEIAPIEVRDVVFRTDYQTAVLIRETDRQEIQELIEFTEAVIGTMEDEGITGVRAGIGREAADIYGIRSSYRDAVNALYIGSVYQRDESVFIYTRQTLERIIDSIPETMKQSIRNEFYQMNSAEPLSGEMLDTVRVFLQNDLNLTASARQLFIHRNTLNYRLDKIKKEFGLDLRYFRDAVIFTLISLIPQDK